MKLTNIKNNPNNPRIIKDDKFKKLVQSIKEFPEMMSKRPLVCVTDVDGKIYPLGGNMRLKAIKELEYKEIPDEWIQLADEWTEEQRREFVIKDNVGFGEWDWDDLANNWDTDKLQDWGLDIPDFAVAEAEAVEDDFEVPDEIQTDIVLGDLFEIGEHRLLCGDSTDSDQVAKLMNGEKADMVFTDPPYGVSYKQGKFTGKKVKKEFDEIANDELRGDELYDFTFSVFKNILININEGCVFYVWSPPLAEGFEIFKAVKDIGVHIQSQIIWDKNRLILGRADYHWQHEICWYGYYGKNHYWSGDRKLTTIWKQNRDTNYNHPTQKPIELGNKAISNSTKTNNLVIDFFSGSGSTMVAAHQLNRKCYGMELDPKYCQVIVDRMRKLDPTIQIKKNGELI
jgi:DNA modification methylase